MLESDKQDRLKSICGTYRTYLNNIVEYLLQVFNEAHLTKDNEQQSVKLHVTLMNTKLRMNENEEEENERKPFDARELLQKFGDFDFGEVKLESIELSSRGAFNESGYWKSLGAIMLP